MTKLTKARDLHRIIAEAIINVAARSPGLRGPFIFDEARLQAAAADARAALEATHADE